VWPGGRGRRLGLGALATAGLFTLGYLGGGFLTDALASDGRPGISGTPSPPTVILMAHGQVTVRLDGVEGFVARPGEDDADGTFGHWCYSGPDVDWVREVSALDVGAYRDLELSLVLILAPPPTDLPVPWVQLRLGDAAGQTPWYGVGQGRVVSREPSSGRVAFEGIRNDGEGLTGLPATLAGEIAWRCGPWLPPE
jgi:hypothetical protein